MSEEKKQKEYEKYLEVPIRKDRKPLQELLPLAQPLRVLIDPSDICNFRCEFCFQSKEKFAGCKMTMETFDLILKQLMEFDAPINVVHMYGLGEPMVNENLPVFIQKLKSNHVAKEVAITSNGSLLTEEMSRRLVAAGLDRLSISLNGIKDEHFLRIAGVHVDFEKFYEQIKYFYQIRESCHLHVKINGDCFDESEKAEFVELFKDCTDSINIDHVVNVWPGLDVTSAEKQTGGVRMYDYDIDNLTNSEQTRKPVCPLMFYELLIHSDGTVSPCAVDYNFKNENLGNVRQQTIKEIWTGDKLRQIHHQTLAGEEISYEICRDCNYTECAATVNITPYRDELLAKFS